MKRLSGLKMASSKLLLQLGLLLAVTGGSISLGGCVTVAPYERAKLAHPTMTAVDLAGAGELHVRSIQEGAIGGSAGAGSGCGCN